MSFPQKPKIYRDAIDSLVQMCRDGQGQIGARRARAGVWIEYATPEIDAINLLFARMSQADREVLAKLLASEVVTGVFETLKVLEEYQISPFENGYEGSPFNDFIGRLDDWDWPEQ